MKVSLSNEARMDNILWEKIKEITEIQAASGYEHRMRQYLRQALNPLVDELQTDGLGGIYGVRHKGNEAPRLMFAAHMDEVGFLVKSITKQGLFKVVPLGGWNPSVVSAQRFTLQSHQGDYPVVSSSIPPHLLKGGRDGQISIEDLFFDGGFESKEEAQSFGVRPGDPIVPDVETIQLANGKTIVGKAWDNRFGVLAILESLRELQGQELSNTLIAGANVQEEVGLRGTKGAVRMLEPDLFFAVDCSPANDLTINDESFGRLGEGTLIRLQDPGFLLPKEVKEFMLDIAETYHIPYQYFISKGGTDAVAAHQMNHGIPSGVIGVSARYIHTHQSVFHIDDFYAAKEMIKQIALNLDNSTLKSLYQE